MNVLIAQRRELLRMQSYGLLSHAVQQAAEIDLDIAEIALDKLEWRSAEPA